MSEENSDDTFARRLTAYSFLVVFANDDTIDEDELAALERIALQDGKVDKYEKEVLANLFSRVDKDKVTSKVWEEINRFSEKFGIS